MADTSSNVSTASTVVGHHGTVIDLELAIDRTCQDIQKHINGVQCQLRQIAQFVENDGEFKEEVKMQDELDDELRLLAWLFDDLRNMGYDLISVPDTPDAKAWLKAHAAERKVIEKRLQLEHATKLKEDRKKEKELMKAARATELTGVAEEEE